MSDWLSDNDGKTAGPHSLDEIHAPQTASGCSLCGCDAKSPARKKLYGQPVRKKCYWAFANRRQGAFLIDYVVLVALIISVNWIFAMATGRVAPSDAGTYASWADYMWWILVIGWLAKDAHGGKTLGRWLCGVSVINRYAGNPVFSTEQRPA